MNDTIHELQGRTVIGIHVDPDENEITFTREDGSKVKFYHVQSCCEKVTIDDVNGDWHDLMNVPMHVAEIRYLDAMKADDDSGTFTFYTFRTIKGSVDVRWYGSSNGFYSERVDMVVITASI